MRRAALLSILVVAAAACGDRSLHPGGGDAGVTDGPRLVDSAPIEPGFCAPDSVCVVAVRTDNCCEAAFPENLLFVSDAACVTLWSAAASTPTPQQCLDRWDPQCALVDCMPAPPPSRVAHCVNHHCEFDRECIDPTDCAIAIYTRACCPCPTVVPAALLDVDRCLVTYPQTGPTPAGCAPQACPAMPCQQCPLPAANCLSQTCQGVVPL